MTESRLMKSSSIISENAIPIENAGGGDDSKKPLESSVTIITEKKIKKRGSSFSLFKAALSIVRPPRKDKDNDGGKKKKSNAKSMDFDHQVNSTGNWTKIVGSMRPLHLQENLQSPPPSIKSSSSVDSLEDLVPRSSYSSSPSAYSYGTMSQYASASNLQDLDNDSESEVDPDEVFDALTGDDMIDSKAEEFIAQFYMKMKLQNVDSTFDR